MAHSIPLLDRNEELALIDSMIQDWGTRCVVCINAPGGFGKTRLLEEVWQRYTQLDSGTRSTPLVTDIIDFDDRTLHIPQIVGRKMSDMLDRQAFEPYVRGLADLRNMEVAGYSSEALLEQERTIERTFVSCFDRVSAQRRVVVLLDSIDALENTTVWNTIAHMLLQTSNMTMLLAGRNARAFGESLQPAPDDHIAIIDLPPLPAAECAIYLQQKQQLLHLSLELHREQTVLWLSGGKLLLLDLVAEWQTQGLALDWLDSYDLDALEAFPKSEQQRIRQAFEQRVLAHVSELGAGMDWLFLVMACVYPLDRETIGRLLGLPLDEASSLYDQARQYVFVKQLPDERISLHDEMRRMINDYVWSEIDPEGDPQRRASRIAAEYLEREIQALTENIANLQRTHQQVAAEDPAEAVLRGFMALEPLEQELWSLKRQLLDHTLIIDLDAGVELFAQLFDEATRANRFSFRNPLLNSIQVYVDLLSSAQQYIFRSCQARYFFDESEYELTCELVTDILKRGDILPDQQVDMFMQRANAEIRLGNMERGIADFRAAVDISETHQFLRLMIRTKNALGWAHRLVGELDLAIRYYREAQSLCLEQGMLGDDYGWILNNLTFVLARQNHRNAIGYGRSAITYWQELENAIGLGAGYLVLGMVYYQSGLHDEALEVLEKSLLIFEPLQLQNWIAQVYTWRGAVYLELGDPTTAEEELLGSLDIGTRNIEPITLNHLGKVYLAQVRWDMAEQYFRRSYERALEIPDFASWIASLSGIISIAAENKQYHRYVELQRQVQDFLGHIKTPDAALLGIAQFGLARLALGQRDINAAIDLLEQSIILVAAHDSMLKTELLDQFALVERDLEPLEPELIRQVGQTLKERFQRKESEEIVYGMVMPVMYRWAHWKEQSTN